MTTPKGGGQGEEGAEGDLRIAPLWLGAMTGLLPPLCLRAGTQETQGARVTSHLMEIQALLPPLHGSLRDSAMRTHCHLPHSLVLQRPGAGSSFCARDLLPSAHH